MAQRGPGKQRLKTQTGPALADGPDACITWPNHSWFVEQSLGQQGELLGNNDNGRSDRATEVYLDSDGMLNYINWWKGLSDSGYYTYTGLQRDWDGTSNAYLCGEGAFAAFDALPSALVGSWDAVVVRQRLRVQVPKWAVVLSLVQVPGDPGCDVGGRGHVALNG